MNTIKTVGVLNLGRMCYRNALKVQEALVDRVKGGGESTLVLVEHPPVYTTGIRSKVYSEEEEVRLRGLGADFVRTNRGGLITFHGPGQLVAYPVLNLRDFAPETNKRKSLLGMKWYVHTLEQLVIDLLLSWRLEGTRSPHTGVWLGNSKICAMGVHSSDMVTSHGLAINCTTDLAWFSHIVPCGILGAGVTSLRAEMPHVCEEELGTELVADKLVKQFEKTFDCHTEPSEVIDTSDILDISVL